jgi:hypothetical protein
MAIADNAVPVTASGISTKRIPECAALLSLRPNLPFMPVQMPLVLCPINQSLVLVSNDLDMALVEAEHLYHFTLVNVAFPNHQLTDLLRTFLVDNLGVVLGLAAVLPNKINDQLAAAFIFAGINCLNFLLP